MRSTDTNAAMLANPGPPPEHPWDLESILAVMWVALVIAYVVAAAWILGRKAWILGHKAWIVLRRRWDDEAERSRTNRSRPYGW